MISHKITFKNSKGMLQGSRLELPDNKPKVYALLRFDFTGLGESEGDFEHTNFSSNIEDLYSAAQFLEDNYEAPSLIIGHSLGGGGKGALVDGVAEYLINDCSNQYNMFVGCSTGSLLMIHLALDNIKIIKTSDGFIKKINHFNTLRTFLKGCPTFGESENLRKLIKKSITKDEFNQLSKLDKKVIFTVSNLTQDTIEFYNSENCKYEEFCDWTWVSCNFTPFMSIYSKNGS